jgi:hypothetical protein
MLAEHGIAIIWRLNFDAAMLHRNGHTAAATALTEMADAAETEWLRLRLIDAETRSSVQG